jgi:hypothetical protein
MGAGEPEEERPGCTDGPGPYREEPGEEPGGLPWAYLGGGSPEKVSNLRGPPGLLQRLC